MGVGVSSYSYHESWTVVEVEFELCVCTEATYKVVK